MKKSIKILLGIIGVLLIGILIDIISIYTNNKPIFAIKGSMPYMYSGLLYDTYSCPQYSIPQVKIKGTKFTCTETEQKLEQYAYTIETTESSQCKKTLYMGRENQNIYTYCLDSIKINNGETSQELKDYYQQNNNVIEEIINALTNIQSYDDGGSKLYRDIMKTDFSNNGLSILQCNTLTGNQDIYIGPQDMEYQTEFCQYDENMKEF